MKYINYIFRFLVGALFIFSGFIKSNDTKGFAIKLHEYFEVFSKDAQATQDTLTIEFETFYKKQSFSVPLYESEKSKTFSLQTNISAELYEIYEYPVDEVTGDTTEIIVEAREMELNCMQASNIVERDTIYGRDSTMAGKANVTVSIAGKEVLKKSYDLIIAKQEISESIDVSPYLKKSGFLVGFFEKMSHFAVPMAMFLCLLEILLGIWLLLGYRVNLTVWLLLLMTLFFTFLTFYSAYYDKVTDCGCFGDAIKLTPWESFNKDVILTIMILVLFFTRKYIKPIFSTKFSNTISIGIMAFCTLFMAYGYLYLPYFDFLKYSEGSDLRENTTYPKGALQSNIIEKTMLYKDANGKEIEVVYNSKTNSFTPAAPIGGTFIKVLNEKVLETAYQLPIHDWGSIYSSYGNDISDSIMDSKGITMLVPAVYVNEIHENAPEQINRIYNTWKSTNHSFYALSSSGPADITAFIEKYKVPFQFGQADNKLLMSMIRSNPGVILIKDGVVIKRWCFRNLPSDKELLKYAQ